MKTFTETIIIKVGGSLLIPDAIDIAFIKRLKEMVRHFTERGYQMVLVIGGGKTCRRYQAAAKEFPHVGDVDLDWIGIKTIHLNAELMFRIFSDLDIHSEVILELEDIKHIQNSVVMVGAWDPGRSSDTDAIEIAILSGAKRVINFSNVTHVYSADPNIVPDATKLEKLSWDEYRALIPADWKPGMSAPFDPVASQKAQEHTLVVAILGASLENLERYLLGESFEGTLLSS